jgi:hypothetical protein
LETCFAAIVQQRKLLAGCLPARRAAEMEDCFAALRQSLEKMKALY